MAEQAPPTARAAGAPRLAHLAAVAAGGAVGGSLRYLLAQLSPSDALSVPWVVLFENVSGAFLLGLLLTALPPRTAAGRDLRPFLATGVLGSFTTFSNLALDVTLLHQHGALTVAAAYLGASVALGLTAAVAGLELGRSLRRRTTGAA